MDRAHLLTISPISVPIRFTILHYFSLHEHISLRILDIPGIAIVNHDATRQKLLTREIAHPKTSIAFLYTSAAVLVEMADSDAPITDAQ